MTGADRVTVDGIRWVLSPAGAEALVPDDLRLANHQEAGRAAAVKHGSHRTVYRVELPTGPVYWKHCRLNGSRAWWRDVVRGPKARLEYNRARELAARGIGTVEPLAWGRFDQRWPAGSFLITRALDGTIPLDEHLIHHPPATPAARRQIAVALAAFVAKLHAAGVTHPDLHPGNLLVRPKPDGPEFFLIDVHDVLLGRPLGPGARLANLALLNGWFRLRVDRTDRLRFWRAYAGPGGSPADARAVEHKTERSIARLWSSREGRCVRDSRHFRKVRGPTAGGFAVRDLGEKVAAEFAADPDAPFARPDAGLLKDSRSATVSILTVPTPAGAREMVYKRFRVTRWTDPLADLVRPSAALRSWVNGHAFLDRGLPTPRPWLYLRRLRRGLPSTGYLLCDRVPDARHLHDAALKADASSKRRLIDVLAGWVRLMHERGCAHRDLKAANLLVTAAGEVWFIDLVGVRTMLSVPRRLRVRDLTRLNASFVFASHVTRTDRLRFLRAYLGWGLRGKGGWKDWWKEIDRGTQAKVRRNAARNRPLA